MCKRPSIMHQARWQKRIVVQLQHVSTALLLQSLTTKILRPLPKVFSDKRRGSSLPTDTLKLLTTFSWPTPIHFAALPLDIQVSGRCQMPHVFFPFLGVKEAEDLWQACSENQRGWEKYQQSRSEIETSYLAASLQMGYDCSFAHQCV